MNSMPPAQHVVKSILLILLIIFSVYHAAISSLKCSSGLHFRLETAEPKTALRGTSFIQCRRP